MKNENDFYFILILTIGLTFLVGAFSCGLFIGKSHKTIKCEFDDTRSITTEIGKYDFIDKDISDYICNLSEQFGLDSDIVVAILMQENPKFNVQATNINANGTIDCGLFQLNDKFIYTDFVPRYWNIPEIEFNVYNWKHNTFIAVSHIYYLKSKLKTNDDVICAYNCGINATMHNRIPESTKIYLSAIQNNIMLLKRD